MTVFAPEELNIDRHQTKALGLLTNSKVWWKAANRLLEVSIDRLTPGAEFAPPIYFLVLQCLECTLKSFLNARGIDTEKLKNKFGHDLDKLLRKARELGLDRLIRITPEMEARISLMAPDYGGKELQYFMGSGVRRWALPAEIIDDVGRIREALNDEYRSQLRAARDASAISVTSGA